MRRNAKPLNSENKRLSIVIPTLGGPRLSSTLSCIFSSSINVYEVILCIPNSFAQGAQLISRHNVKVLRTSKEGQVAQRSQGFRYASGEIVLQLDDDISFDTNCLRQALDGISQLGPGNVLGPLYYDDKTGNVSESETSLNFGIRNFYLTYIGRLPSGRRKFGSFSPLTSSLGISLKYLNSPLQEVMWLPGGFVIGYRSDLILDDFYPFPGKAYCEDLIHSTKRAKKGVRHFVSSSLKVVTSVEESANRVRDLRSYLRRFDVRFKVLRRRLQVARLLDARVSLIILYFTIEFTLLLINTIVRLRK